jgi:hypothetical protein
MTAYFNTETKEYPRHDGDLKLLGWSEGEQLPKNWVEVIYVEPIMEEYTVFSETLPILINGQWTTNWTSYKLSDAEIAELEASRAEREANRLNPPDVTE